MVITIYNSKSKVHGTLEEIHILRKNLRLRVPGAFYSPAYQQRKWDGFCYYISEAGYISTGLIPKLINLAKSLNLEYEIDDCRQPFKYKSIPHKLGKLEFRDYQYESVKSVLKNKIEGINFNRGILDEATNAGKSLIAAGLFKSFDDSKSLIFIVNRQHLYFQAKKELQELIGNEIGYIGPDGIKWDRFVIATVQTINSKLSNIKNQLHKFDMCLVDECHYASSATYKRVLENLQNCYVRVGLSGTPFDHKDKNKNEAILSYFGPILHSTTNNDLIEKGFSTKPIVTILKGNTLVKLPGEYKQEEEMGLIKSSERNKAIISRVKKHYTKGRIPLLLVCKYHHHVELVYKKVIKKFPELRIKFIHVKVKNRLSILNEFKEGKLDILVSSKLIKEGQNLPLIRALILAGGGDSNIDVLQLVGRALRKHHSKKVVYIDDFFDEGAYLKRHSKHRIKAYKDEKFKVIEKYKQ